MCIWYVIRYIVFPHRPDSSEDWCHWKPWKAEYTFWLKVALLLSAFIGRIDAWISRSFYNILESVNFTSVQTKSEIYEHSKLIAGPIFAGWVCCCSCGNSTATRNFRKLPRTPWAHSINMVIQQPNSQIKYVDTMNILLIGLNLMQPSQDLQMFPSYGYEKAESDSNWHATRTRLWNGEIMCMSKSVPPMHMKNADKIYIVRQIWTKCCKYTVYS